jgi:surface protein
MNLYLNLMPDLRNIVTGYFGDVIFSRAQFSHSQDFLQAQDEVNEVTFATAEEFKKSKAIDCIFINFEITSTNHYAYPDIPKTLLRCSGVPKIKTHTLAFMFQSSKFNGDLSRWDVSSVTNMSEMFDCSIFNGDISQWDVSSVDNMVYMFRDSAFNDDISQWDVSSVDNMGYMFEGAQFNGDISQWDVSNVTKMQWMFCNSQFNGVISQWNTSRVVSVGYIFTSSKIKKITVQKWNNFKNHNIDEMF